MKTSSINPSFHPKINSFIHPSCMLSHLIHNIVDLVETTSMETRFDRSSQQPCITTITSHNHVTFPLDTTREILLINYNHFIFVGLVLFELWFIQYGQKTQKMASIQVAPGSLFHEPNLFWTCGFRREFRKRPSFHNIISVFPKNLQFFIKKFLTFKNNTFPSLLNDPDFFWKIRLCQEPCIIDV